MDTMSSAEEIAAAVSFAWERPAKKTRRVGVFAAVVLILGLVGHASFAWLAVRLLGR